MPSAARSASAASPPLERDVQPIWRQTLTNNLLHCSHIRQWQLWVARTNLRAEILTQRFRVSGCANSHHRLWPRALCERHTDLRRCRIAELLEVADIVEDPHDLPLDRRT